jgi:CheY-like chemotaxis protein
MITYTFPIFLCPTRNLTVPPVCLWGIKVKARRPILVADSNLKECNLLVATLLPLGHTVLAAKTEASVLAVCASRRPCLIVLGRTDDENIDATTLLRRIKHLAGDKTPLVAVRLRFTARNKPKDEIRIIGPFVLEDLLDSPIKRLKAPQENETFLSTHQSFFDSFTPVVFGAHI